MTFSSLHKETFKKRLSVKLSQFFPLYTNEISNVTICHMARVQRCCVVMLGQNSLVIY